MNGSGCKNCPVKPCETMNYRGSACAAQRAKFGLGDPKTNADRIRAMSDEELAELLSNEVPHDCAYCNLVCATFDGDKFAGSCQNAFYRWLQQPAKGE